MDAETRRRLQGSTPAFLGSCSSSLSTGGLQLVWECHERLLLTSSGAPDALRAQPGAPKVSFQSMSTGGLLDQHTERPEIRPPRS